MDQTWATLNNPFNEQKYNDICTRFDVDKRTNLAIKDGLNTDSYRGIGTFITQKGVLSLGGLKPEALAPSNMVFTKPGYSRIDSEYLEANSIGDWKVEIKRIHQEVPDNAWNQFMLETSQGFTNTGLDRIDESIRIYVRCILGSQSHTKVRMSEGNIASAAKNEFAVLLGQCINRIEDVSESLSKYEQALTYSDNKVDFYYGIGVQMPPSVMMLKINPDTIGYNNLIRRADRQDGITLNSAKTHPLIVRFYRQSLLKKEFTCPHRKLQ